MNKTSFYEILKKQTGSTRYPHGITKYDRREKGRKSYMKKYVILLITLMKKYCVHILHP